jgi:hypothetical protein
VGLLTAPLSLAREPLRLTLRAWEVGLSTAAEAARIGTELLDPDRDAAPPDFDEPRDAPAPVSGDNGQPQDVEPGSPAEPEAVVPETGYVAPEPGEAGPAPDVLDVEGPAPDVPPPVPDELVPDHVDEDPVLVAEAAEEGAEDGAGPELHVQPPWDGYDRMTAADIRDRLAAATATEAAAVELYETTGRNRRSVLDAAERALRGAR